MDRFFNKMVRDIAFVLAGIRSDTRAQGFIFNGCLERLVELKDRSRSAPPVTMIDTFAGWRSIRFPGGTP